MKPDLGRIAAVAYTTFGLVAGGASIYSAWVLEPQPSWAQPVALAVLILIVVSGAGALFVLWPVLRKNPRGVTLVRAVKSIGLVDAESRNEGDRHLPPEAVYTLSGLRELAITGITAASSFRNHLAPIKALLAQKKDVYFLICDDATPGLGKMSVLENRDVEAEIHEVKEVIRREGLLDDERFHIKAFNALPTFTALMINGDLVPRLTTPSASGGFLRVQPRRMESSHHDGIILQFYNTDRPLDGFNLFAQDLRTQWKLARAWE